MIRCDWRVSFSLPVSPTWISGAYLVKLTAADGGQSYVPFTVREAVPRAPILVVSSVTTWQAYSEWGGRSLYRGPDPVSGKSSIFARSHDVSFDRPYQWPGAIALLQYELPLISWMESRGFDAAYATSIDLQDGDADVSRRAVFVSASHDEYYTAEMRHALESAVGSGTSLLFLAANAIFRHIKLEPSALGADRTVVNTRVGGWNGQPPTVGGLWRNPPTRFHEQRLLGVETAECFPATAPWVATGSPSWLYRQTGFRAGDRVSDLVGREYDRTFSRIGGEIIPRPAGLLFVARSPTDCRGKSDEQQSTFYVAPSGAGVFAAGTLRFNCALGPGCKDYRHGPDERLRRLTANMLNAMLSKQFS